MIRSLLISVAVGLIALTSQACVTQAAKQPTAPKTEKELRTVVEKNGYATKLFIIDHYDRGRYIVQVFERQQTEGKKAALAFLKSLGIAQTRIIWEVSPDLGREGQLSPSLKLLDRLPYKTKNVRIEWDDYSSKVVVIPLVEINQGRYATRSPQEELAAVWPKYERACNEAVAWLKKHGFSTKQVDLEFWMEDFWPKGKKIVKP